MQKRITITKGEVKISDHGVSENELYHNLLPIAFRNISLKIFFRASLVDRVLCK